MLDLADVTKNELHHFSAHLVRDWWQQHNLSRLRRNLLDQSCTDTAIVVMDYKQKILPTRKDEPQTDYFGKSGLSLLGFMVETVDASNTQALDKRFLDIAVASKTQKACDVMAGLQALLEHFEELSTLSHIENIILVSDNATAYTAASHVPFIHAMRSMYSPRIVKWIFTEAQCGKSFLDAHFAFVNTQLQRALKNNVNYLSVDGLIEALSYDGGIRGTTVARVDMDVARDGVHEYCVNTVESFKPRLQLRSMHEHEYTDDSVKFRFHCSLDPYFQCTTEQWRTALDSVCTTSCITAGADSRPIRPRPVASPDSASANRSSDVDQTETFAHRLQRAVRAAQCTAAPLLQRPYQAAADRNTSAVALKQRWAKKGNKTWMKMPCDVKSELCRMFDLGRCTPGSKMSAEQASEHLRAGLLQRRWDSQ